MYTVSRRIQHIIFEGFKLHVLIKFAATTNIYICNISLSPSCVKGHDNIIYTKYLRQIKFVHSSCHYLALPIISLCCLDIVVGHETLIPTKEYSKQFEEGLERLMEEVANLSEQDVGEDESPLKDE